jgi:hypothetical protein
MNSASNTRLRLNYPSWSRPRSHWSAIDPRNQQTTFRAETHQHHSGNLHGLLHVLHRSDRWPAPVRPVDRAGQSDGYSSCTTNVLERLSDFSRQRNKNTLKTQPHRTRTLHKANQNSTNITQRHTDSATHPRQIPQMAHTGQTGQKHQSDRCNLGSLG